MKSQPESQTETHAIPSDEIMSRLHERAATQSKPLLMEQQVTEPSKSLEEVVYKPQRPSPVIVFSIFAVIIALVISVTMVLVSQRGGPETVPRSGPLIVDSEPRGARVIFRGYGSRELNDRYGGAKTPFTVDEGIPVGAILRADFVREGYAKSEVELPQVVQDEVPPALFAELVPDTEANKAVLSFTSDPKGAEVYLGGNKLEGVTPIEEVRVVARQLHRIEVRLDGYDPHVESVYLEPGGREMVSAYLRPEDEELSDNEDETDEPELLEEPEDRVIEERATIAQVPRSDKRNRAKKRNGKGFLKLDAPLQLEVWTRGKLLGKTPLRREALPTGQNRLRLESRAEGLVLNRRVKIASGDTKEMELELRKGNVAVQAIPWANVKRGTQAPVQTPTRLTGLFEGEYRLRFECP
ncbi:MAG: PEGA domain-containing protein, partial [Myxococcota bacterium]